jgi:hypothetical protein
VFDSSFYFVVISVSFLITFSHWNSCYGTISILGYFGSFSSFYFPSISTLFELFFGNDFFYVFRFPKVDVTFKN